MKVFKKSNKIQKAHKVYKDHKWSIGLSVFLLGAVFFIGTVNHASALGANISTNPEALEEIKFNSSPSESNLAGTGDPELYGALYGCDTVAPLTGSLGALTTVGQNFTSGITLSEYACSQEKIDEGTLDATSFYTQLQRNSGLNSYARMATIVLLDQKPASGRSYIEEKVYALSHLGQVSAQNTAPNVPYYYPGTGYSLLSPIQDFWGWSVNIVYGFLIILIVIVAFGIMFRSKLGGSAAVTLQSAIPSIAMAMVLVPLSYAISGLAIDFITLGTNVTHEFIMGPGAPAREVYTQRPPYFDAEGNPTGNTNGEIDIEVPLFGVDSGLNIQDRGYYADDTRLTWYSSWNLVNVSEPVETLLSNSVIFDNDIMKFINDIVGFLSSLKGFSVSLTGGVQFGEKATLQAWIGDIINFFIQLLLLFTGLRIFWLLIKKFFVLLISPIFSPFIFATVAIPGTGLKNVMTYGKSLYVAAMFYIITYTMFLISLIFSSSSFQSTVPDFANSGYVPPLLGIGPLMDILTKDNQAGPAGTTGFILSLLAVVVYLQIPKVLKDFDKKMGTDKSPLAPMLSSTLESARYSIATPGVIKGKAEQAYGIGRGVVGATSSLPGSFRDAWDKRVRGINPGEEGSWRYGVRTRSAERQASLERQSKEGSGLQRRTAQARLLLSNASSGSGIGGSNASQAFNPNEDVKIEAEIGWTAGDSKGGFIKWTRDFIDDIVHEYELTGSKEYVISDMLSLNIKAVNTSLPAVITASNTTILKVEKVDPATSAVKKVGGASGKALISPRSSSNFVLTDIFDLLRAKEKAGSSGSLYVCAHADTTPTTSGVAASIPLDIVIRDAFALFGYDPSTGKYNIANAVLKPSKSIVGDKIALSWGKGKITNMIGFGISIEI